MPCTWTRLLPADRPDRQPYLGQLGDLLAHFQVQVLGIFHSDPGLEGHAAGCWGWTEFPLTGRAVILLPARPGRHLQRDVSDAPDGCELEGRCKRWPAGGGEHRAGENRGFPPRHSRKIVQRRSFLNATVVKKWISCCSGPDNTTPKWCKL